jgi:hypothetical protein
MKKPRKRNHEITSRGIARKLAAYHSRVLLVDLSIQGMERVFQKEALKTQGMIRDLTLRIDRALTELHEEHAFVDKLTEKLPASPSSGHGMVFGDGFAHTHVFDALGHCSCGMLVTFTGYEPVC